VGDDAQPRLLEQILGDVTPAGEARQEAEEAGVEFRVDAVERRGFACPQLRHELELELPVHASHNARRAAS